MKERDTHNYTLKKGRKTVYIGTTNDLERREQEHHNSGKDFDKMIPNGPAVSKETAAKREEQALKTFMKNHDGKLPKYNKNKSGK